MTARFRRLRAAFSRPFEPLRSFIAVGLLLAIVALLSGHGVLIFLFH